jgi:hypothetical protein
MIKQSFIIKFKKQFLKSNKNKNKMKKVIIALTLCTTIIQNTQAQGFLSKLKDAMSAPAKNGLYEVALTTKNSFESLQPPSGLKDFHDYYGSIKEKFWYESGNTGRGWYELLTLPGLTEKVYENGPVLRDAIAICVEDSLYYFITLRGNRINYSDYTYAVKDIVAIASADKNFIKEIKGWKLTDAPKNVRMAKHLKQIENAFTQIKTGLANKAAAADKANDDRIFNSPLPKPYGDMGQTKMFEAARKAAPALLRAGLENLDIDWLVPLYAYDGQQTRNFTILKDNIGNPIGRGTELWVVCKNNKPGEYNFAKKLYKTKYVVMRLFVKEDGSGNAFTGKYYVPMVSTNALVMVGDDKDPMQYKK